LQAGTRENRERAERSEQGTINVVLNCGRNICKYLFEGLGDVYSKEDRAMVKHIGTTLSLKELRPVTAAQKNITMYMMAAENIDPEMLKQCDVTGWRSNSGSSMTSWAALPCCRTARNSPR
jgi:hypothetical protein